MDQAVTITYMHEGSKGTIRDLAVLRRLSPSLAAGMSRADALVVLRRHNPNEIIGEEGGALLIGQLEFRFDAGGKLLEVSVQ